MDNNQKNFTEFKVRVTFFLNFLPLNQRKIAENIGIEESYLTAIKKGKIKTGGYKLWKGVQKKYPKWVPFLQGETTYPPGSMPLPEVDKEETKKLYKNVCLFSRNLRYYMLRHHYTQKTLALRVNCSQATIHRYLHYTSNDDLKKAQRVYLTSILNLIEVTLEEMTSIDFEKEGRGIKEPHTSLEPDLISMARAVLSSHTTYSNALSANIRAFYQAVNVDQNHPCVASRNRDFNEKHDND